MAVVVMPLGSAEAHGKIDHTLIYTKWRDLNCVKTYAKPEKPRTATQQIISTACADADIGWHDLSQPKKDNWDEYAREKGKIGVCEYIGYSVVRRIIFPASSQYYDFKPTNCEMIVRICKATVGQLLNFVQHAGNRHEIEDAFELWAGEKPDEELVKIVTMLDRTQSPL